MLVTSDLPAFDILRECPAVRFAKADDPDSLAQAIVGILRMSPQERAELGRPGREFVRHDRSWDNLAAKTAAAIKRWLSNR